VSHLPAITGGLFELAGHADVRTTQIYVAVSDEREQRGIAALEQAPHPLAAVGWERGQAA
jgi:site-specific recombinase XerC